VRFWRNFKRSPTGQLVLSLSATLVLVILSLPWPLGLDTWINATFFGIPAGYFLLTLAFPLAMLAVTLWHALLASEAEPFTGNREHDG
jgi:hypothetical protein